MSLLNSSFDFLTKIGLERTRARKEAPDEVQHFMMAAMEEIGERANPENDHLAAGYTYFGQLLAHDISVHRFLSGVAPSLRLRTLYGLGPGSMPYIFEYKPLQNAGLRFRGVKLTLEHYKTDFGVAVDDVPRYRMTPNRVDESRSDSIPLMADARNDQNFILSQLFIQFAKLHNFIADMYSSPSDPDIQDQGFLFKKASSALIGLYQAVILYDYLPKILYDPKLVNHLLERNTGKNNFVFYTGNEGEVKLSEIFTRAAFRFGHAQVRSVYTTFEKREPIPLFAETGLDLRGFIRDNRRAMDWKMFFGVNEKGKLIQPAKKINHHISLPLNQLPFLRKDDNSLVKVNLRHSTYNLPDGMEFYSKFREILTTGSLEEKSRFTETETRVLNEQDKTELKEKIRSITNGAVGADNLPLWLFLLLEAEIIGEGKKLGPLGSRIVAEQIIWAILDDEESIILKPGNFPSDIYPDPMTEITLPDLLRWVNPDLPQIPKTDSNDLESMKKVASEHSEHVNENSGEQPYRGNEFHKIYENDLNNKYKSAVKGVSERTGILNNGFYDVTTLRDKDYVKLCRTRQYNEPSGRAKQQIRVYVSRRNILYNLGFTGMDSTTLDGTTATEDIKGLLFIFGLDMTTKNLAFIVRRIDIDGKAPQSDDLWYITHHKLLVMPDESCVDENLQPVDKKKINQDEVYGELVGQFIKDGFGMLKTKGIPDPIEIKRKVLLKLLGIDEANDSGDKTIEKVEFHLCATKGQEILDKHDLSAALPEGEPQETVPDALFFNLALKSTSSANETPAPAEANVAFAAVENVLISEANRPYPYWCYPG